MSKSVPDSPRGSFILVEHPNSAFITNDHRFLVEFFSKSTSVTTAHSYWSVCNLLSTFTRPTKRTAQHRCNGTIWAERATVHRLPSFIFSPFWPKLGGLMDNFLFSFEYWFDLKVMFLSCCQPKAPGHVPHTVNSHILWAITWVTTI